ncbi:MAG: hypothetical protein KC503_34110 [Myxococcales bacterium]|nr:hypothetical protein [Myxococcales bacterium]
MKVRGVLIGALLAAALAAGGCSDDGARGDANGGDASADIDRDPATDAAPDADDAGDGAARDARAENTPPVSCTINASATGGSQYLVTVNVRNLQSGRVTLQVNGVPTVNSPQPLSGGVATFSSVEFAAPANKQVTFDAEVLAINSTVARCQQTITINVAATPCSLSTQPAPTQGPQGRPTLPAGPLQVDVQTPGTHAELFVNMQSQGTMPVSAGMATFTLTISAGPLALQASCSSTATGQSGQSTPVQYLVQ